MRKRKYLTTLVCLTLGILLLSGAAYANYDNAAGYSNLKNAAKAMLKETNYSANMEMTLDYDGQSMAQAAMDAKMDLGSGDNLADDSYSVYSTTTEYDLDGQKLSGGNGSWEIAQDGMHYSQYGSDDTWYKSTYEHYNRPLPEDDETVDKTVRFLELLGDTMIGDLKNNFVLTKNDGALKTYEINLQREQIPEIINAGLSMIFSQIENSSNSMETASYVTWDALPEDADYEDLQNRGYEMLEEKGNVGIVYIESDGTLVYYPTYAEYSEARLPVYNTSSIESLSVGSDPHISNAAGTFTLDEQGRVTSAKGSGTLAVKDQAGVEHKLTLTLNCEFYDYGTTEPERLPEGATFVEPGARAEKTMTADVVTQDDEEADPTDTEPNADPAAADQDTDPADTDPADTDPADTDPADTDPADIDPAPSNEADPV